MIGRSWWILWSGDAGYRSGAEHRTQRQRRCSPPRGLDTARNKKPDRQGWAKCLTILGWLMGLEPKWAGSCGDSRGCFPPEDARPYAPSCPSSSLEVPQKVPWEEPYPTAPRVGSQHGRSSRGPALAGHH